MNTAILLNLPIKILYGSPLLFSLPRFFGWMCDHPKSKVLLYYIMDPMLNDIMEPNLSSVGALVTEEHCCVFYAARYQIYCRFDTNNMTFVSTLIWDHIQTNMHRRHRDQQNDTHRYKYIITPPVMCTHQLPVLHWMNNLLRQKFTLQKFTKSLLFKNYFLAEIIYLLIRFNDTKLSLWNTKDTVRNGVNEENTHNTHIQRER